jgi:hypothetical protein
MSALTTHTFGKQREKETEKKTNKKKNSNKRSNAEKGKEQDHLKKTCLGPLMQGQRLDTFETKPCSSKEHKPPKHTRAPHAHMQAPPEQVPNLGTTGQAGSQNRSDRFHQNRSDRFSKPVRPISHKPHPQKPKMQKKCTSSPLAIGIGSRDAR